MRRLALALFALALALPALAQAQEPQTSLADLEDEVMCPICGVTLELATEAPQAIQQREFIRDRIAEGMTKDEIKDALVAEFGKSVLAVPDTEGFDLAAWLVPGGAILAAALAIFFGLRRWQQGGDASTDPDRSRSELSEEESGRLDADLARYDL
jgi:cytochrome c-type biogenesis protein CcmH/NrfF